MKRFTLIASGLIALSCGLHAQSWDTQSDTWVTVDGLGREVPGSDAEGMPATIDKDAQIGIFYYMWHRQTQLPAHVGFDKDVSVLLREDPDHPDWGYGMHWWGKPVLGYYTAGDPYVVAKHMQMIADAGIDFLFFDTTNSWIYDTVVRKVMAELDRREALGLKPIKLAFAINAKQQQRAEELYNTFYKYPEYDKYWFKYDGKPLILGDKEAVSGTEVPGLIDAFTWRKCWAWMKGEKPNEWAWLENYPQAPGWTGTADNKQIEQISVSTAQHATTKIGKSYHNGKEPAYDKYGLCKETPQGLYFQEQWNQALKVHPKIVMITQFNEWTANRYVLTEEDAKNNSLWQTRPGGQEKVGESYFVDAYNEEFNRDVEPSWNSVIRDNYYLQMCANIRKFRGVHQIPKPDKQHTIDIAGDMAQWDNITPEYRDDRGDNLKSEVEGVQSPDVTARTASDIVISKVASDDKNLYFYVQTDKKIASYAFSQRWMKLLINTDLNYKSGWNGYDYMVYKNPETKKFTLMRNRNAFGTYKWTAVGEVTYRVDGNKLHLSIPKADLKLEGNTDIDFKWADNTSEENTDILAFITDGDVAPNGRFNYRYKGSALGNSGVATVKKSDQRPLVSVTATSDDTISVSLNGGIDREALVSVYNMQGIPVGKSKVNETDAEARFSGLSKGLYLVDATSGNRHSVVKVAL